MPFTLLRPEDELQGFFYFFFFLFGHVLSFLANACKEGHPLLLLSAYFVQGTIWLL